MIYFSSYYTLYVITVKICRVAIS